QLRDDGLVRVRVEAERLLRIYDRAQSDDKVIASRIEALIASLPQPDRLERIRTLAQIQRWQMEDGELQAELDTLVARLEPHEADQVVEMTQHEIPAAWEIGHAL